MFLGVLLFAFLTAQQDIRGPEVSEKAARTPAQQKINSQLLYEIYKRRGEAEEKQVPRETTGVRIDADGRALVDIRAEVSASLLRTIVHVGGRVVATSAPDRSVIARVPVLRLETLAADPAVRFIEPAAEATTQRGPR
jgi:hypothetical protein